MCSIAEKRFLRPHSWLVILLALTALSLMTHFVADAVHISAGSCWVQKMGESRQAGENTHAVDLHGRFLLSERSTFGLDSAFFVLGDMTTPLGLTWIPPTPVRPPITL